MNAMSAPIAHPDIDLAALSEIERRVLWLATWTIHNANHLRAKPTEGGGDVKVGGHQASSASLATIMTSLYCAVLRAEDRVAVKPHASPIYHALHYMAGNQTLEKLKNFRGFGGVQSYPSRTKDIDDVDFSTGSVGLGVAQTLFSSLVQDYVSAHKMMGDRPEGRMIALIGDAEMDEGNIYEALIEGWKHGLRNCWWVVDYNRQSLDAVVREGLWEKFEHMFKSFGWRVSIIKYGALQKAAFAEPGGEALRGWIDSCPNQLYSALSYQGGAAWRKRLRDDLGDQGDFNALLERRSDDEIAALMTNLGGHDHQELIAAFEEAAQDDTPTMFIAYTVKGHNLPLAGHKDNHAGLLTPKQMEAWRAQMDVREGHEWDTWEGARVDEGKLQSIIDTAPVFAHAPRRLTGKAVEVPAKLPETPRDKPISTQMGFGQILAEIAREGGDLADHIVTTSPDVTVSTNLGGWVNRRGLFAKEELADTFKAEQIPSTYKWSFSQKGQHFELGIAESNLFVMLGALGLSHSINGARLLPIGTVYDPFIMRAADQLNYACYQDARFMLVATPSGTALAPEGGAHQSIGTPLVGMAQDRLAYFEPAFVDELSVIMRFGFEFMQAEPGDGRFGQSLLCDDAGGSIYLRLSTRPIEQPKRAMTPELEEGIIKGAYWHRKPGPNPEVVVAYTGTTAPEAIAAMAPLAETKRDIGLLAITSADRLHKAWATAQSHDGAERSHIENLLADLPPHCLLVTVIDGHPTTLSWLGSVRGHRVKPLGVDSFGQTGTVADLFRHFGLDSKAIVNAATVFDKG